MLSKYPQSQIMMINGTNTGTGLSIAFVSLLMFIYTQQFANVRWGNSEVKPSSPSRKCGLFSHRLLLQRRKNFQDSQEAEAWMLDQLCLHLPFYILGCHIL